MYLCADPGVVLWALFFPFFLTHNYNIDYTTTQSIQRIYVDAQSFVETLLKFVPVSIFYVRSQFYFKKGLMVFVLAWYDPYHKHYSKL